MTFLGKLRLAAGKPLVVRDDGLLDLMEVGPDDPRAVFFAYDVGDGYFQLRSATTGQWLHLSAGEVNSPWPVLVWAGTSAYGTRFLLSYLDVPRGIVALNFYDSDGRRSGLTITTGINPYCRCVFDATNGFLGYKFGLKLLAPGLREIQRAKSCAGADLGRVGKAAVDLAGADLAGVDASRATLTGARLDRALLAGAKLGGANLRGASLAGTDFRGADLTDADLRETNVADADFRDLDDGTAATLAGTNLSGTDVTRTRFRPPPICTSRSNPMKLAGATVAFSSLQLDWSSLDLSGATIVGLPVDADGAARLPGLRAVGSVLIGFDFHHANLKAGPEPVNFSGAVLSGANFAGADCTRAIFQGATLGGAADRGAAVLASAYLFNADFRDAQLSGVNFAGAYLYGGSASVSGATMPGVNFAGAYLTSLDLSNVRDRNLAGAVFDRACLVNCNFTGTTVVPDSNGRGGSFVAACLQGADFSGANLPGATMVDAGIAPPCPSPGTCKFPATLRFGGMHVQIEIAVRDAGTILPENATNSTTVCPNRQHGPCTGTKLSTAGAPRSWPVGAAGELDVSPGAAQR